MELTKIRYKFDFSDGRHRTFELHLESDSMTPVGWVESHPPEWAALEFHQCRNCPLKPDDSPYCPAALNLSRVVSECADLDPLEAVRLHVQSGDRNLVMSTSVQRGISSLMGLVMATSDCPHTRYFKPIAKYHIPLSGEEETIYRALATYLIGQLFRSRNGDNATFDLDELLQIYSNMEVVNTTIAGRLKAAGDMDAGVKPLLEWDIFSGMFAMRVEDMLGRVKPLFKSYLKQD